jgi:energy-coupling factor transporter ATP-binding protein EcfA2
MLTELTIDNFKCFKHHKIPLRPTTIIVGRNNAGKSTIIEALRLISLVSNRLQGLSVRDVPRWLDIPKVNQGVSPSLDNQNFDFGNVFHRYADPPATILARFSTGVSITIYIGGPEKVHAVIKDKRNVVISKGQARKIGMPKVGILPQIGPLLSMETVLVPEYVLKCLSSSLASIQFRNQLNLLFDQAFAEFKNISESTWQGLAVQELRGRGGRHNTELALMVRNDDFVAEVGNMGHGLQMWLQIMWFLARCTSFDTVILDEPDVYMHADLQRKLIRFMKGRHEQVIVATHSVEIMSEVEPDTILVVDRERRQAQFTTDVPEVQSVVDQIGAVQNLQLARLWGSHRCLFVEGKDIGLLKYFQNKLFPNSPGPIDAIPSMQVGGWSGWSYAVGSSMLLNKAVGRNIRSYCIFDSDFHTQNQIISRKTEAQEKGLNLHIWAKKEIENYLLDPKVIHRVVGKRVKSQQEIPSVPELSKKLFEIAEQMQDALMDGLANEFLSENRAGGLKPANILARERIASICNTEGGKLSAVSGKVALSKLSEWIQGEYGVSISAAAIAREMRPSETPAEIAQVLTAIEYGEPFN